MAKLWRRAWGWVGTGERRSRILPHVPGSEPVAPPVVEEGRAPAGRWCPARSRPGTRPRGPSSQARTASGAPLVDQHLALLRALAGHRDHPPVEVEVAHVERRRARPPASRCRRAARAPRRHGAIDVGRRPSAAERRVRRASGRAPRGRGPGAGASRARGQRAGPTGRMRPGPAGAPLEVGPQRGRRPRDGRLGVAPGRQVREVATQRRIRSTSAGPSAPPRPAHSANRSTSDA